MKILATIILGTCLFAQTTRTVTLNWIPSSSSGVVGYNVLRATSASGPFATLNSAAIPTTNYLDTTAVVGSTYTYEVVALLAACTPTSDPTIPCGQSSVPSLPATTTVPPQPNVTITVVITVQ
jgi:hypothetical protein